MARSDNKWVKLKLMFFFVILLIIPLNTKLVAVTFTSSDWVNMKPNLAPNERDDVAMAYDSESDRVILFSGDLLGSLHFNDLWAYDYDANTWSNLTIDSIPDPRAAGGMVYDEESDRMILFGGWSDSEGYFDDTWAYDYNTNAWQEMSPSTSPPARSLHHMTYDSESDRIILFGGWDVSDELLDDTWAYDYNNNSWVKMNPSSSPPPLAGVRIVYDSESDLIALFGGLNSIDPFLSASETWAYDYNTDTWVNKNPENHPPAVAGHGMAYNNNSDRIIFYGGDYNMYKHTWSYDINSNTWTDLNATFSPLGHAWLGFVYNPKADRIISFGGEALKYEGEIPIKGVSNETWVYPHPVTITNGDTTTTKTTESTTEQSPLDLIPTIIALCFVVIITFRKKIKVN